MFTRLLLLMILVSWVYYLVSTLSAWNFFRKAAHRSKRKTVVWPPVSIIKPVAGIDASALENLATFCRQDYPRFELVFALADRMDPGLEVVQKLKIEFPQIDIRWVIADQNRGPNYKVGNLAAAIEHARYDLFIISDSDMRVAPDYLREVVDVFGSTPPESQEENIGLVTCLYRGAGIDKVTAAWHALTIHTDFIPNVLLDHTMKGISYAFGATICISRENLQCIGGIEPLQNYLADDYQLGYRIRRLGKQVAVSHYLVEHVCGLKKFRDYFSHQLRWAITQRVCRPLGYGASIVTRGVFFSFFLAAWSGFNAQSLTILTTTCILRWGTTIFLNNTVIRSKEMPRYFWLIPLNDLVNTMIWALSLVRNEVRWRDRRFRVLKSGKMVELN